jgi:hypothetical protein
VYWVRLASSLIAYNLRCNLRHENKVLVPILFLIGRFHQDHLYKWHVTPGVTLCMITPSLNKWMFTFVNTSVTFSHCIYLTQSLHHNLLDVCKYLSMQSSIWQMVGIRTSDDAILDIHEGFVGHGHGLVPRGGAPPPPYVSLEQLLATQNDLKRRLVENHKRCGAECQQPRHQERDLSYSDFLATHPLAFATTTNPLEADSWLRTTESKFRLLHCIEY